MYQEEDYDMDMLLNVLQRTRGQPAATILPAKQALQSPFGSVGTNHKPAAEREHEHIHICMYIHIHVCTELFIRIHAHTDIYIHIHMHMLIRIATE